MSDNLTTTTQVDSGIEVYYDRVLLKNARPKLVHTKFAQQKPLPKGKGKTIKFRRYAMLSTATTQLAEGVTPSGKRLSKTDLLATVAQYGDFVHVTDVVDMTVADPVLTVAGQELGDQMGRTVDEIVRDILVACASSTTASSGVGTATKMNRPDIDSVVQTLLNNDASMITSLIKAGTGQGTSPVRPSFWGVMHTELIDDLEDVSGFKSTANYPAQSNVDDAEWGSTGNVRWLASSVAHSDGSATDPFDGSGDYYYLPIIGKNAYGVVDLESGNAKNIVKPYGSGGTADPLNQRATSGWKTMFTSRILNDNFMHLLKVTHS